MGMGAWETLKYDVCQTTSAQTYCQSITAVASEPALSDRKRTPVCPTGYCFARVMLVPGKSGYIDPGNRRHNSLTTQTSST